MSEPQTPQNPSRQVTLESVKKMSDEELDSAVAKIQGWEQRLWDKDERLRPTEPILKWFYPPDPYLSKYPSDNPPRYSHDLNAVREVEKFVFHPYSEWGARLFEQNLAKILFPTKHINDIGHLAGEIAAIAHASARQRCEALVPCLSPTREL